MSGQGSTFQVVIEAGARNAAYWSDLWRYRELFRVLAWRDVAVRYKQTLIGVAWAVIRPLLTMIIFTVVFGRVAKLPSEAGAPYALMVFAGMLPWSFVASALTDAAGSLVTNASLISKVYFPRLVVPTAAVVVALADLFVGFLILAALMAWYRIVPGLQVLLLPFFVALAFLAALGPGLLFAAMNVKYRDFRYAIPFLVQFGLYLSPVGFSSSVVPQQWRLLYALNPMVGIIDGFRWCLLGGDASLDATAVIVAVTVVGLMLWVGFKRFRSMEREFADLI